MQKLSKTSQTLKTVPFLLGVCAMSLLSTMAHADLAGGLAQGTSVANQIANWLKVILPLCAVIYLTWKAIMIWQGRADWGDFIQAIAHVAVVGGAAAIAAWAFGVFG